MVSALAIMVAIPDLFSQQKFNVYSFVLPSGFTSQEVQGSLVLTSPDGRLSILMVPVKNSTDDFYTAFGKEWEKFVSSRYSVLGFPNRKGTSFKDDWYMTTGQSKVSDGKQILWIQLRNFTKSEMMASMLFFAENENQQELISEFVKGVSLSYEEGGVKKSESAKQPVEVTKAVSSVKAFSETPGDFEIWMKIRSGPFNNSEGFRFGSFSDLTKYRMGYKILFSDGNYTGDEIPDEGFITFSANSTDASKYTWGKYTRDEKHVNLKSQFENLDLTFKSQDVLEEYNSVYPYYRCKPVDGLKLNSSWSYITDSEKDPYYDQPGCRQVIYFGNDGRFDDRGVFVGNCLYPNEVPEKAPGRGRYEIRKFTIILHYDDGRTKYNSFTGSLMNDPFVNNEVIYIGGKAFYKRNK